MHEMDNTKRIITIIGLVFEGINVLGIGFCLYLFANIESQPWMTADMSQEEYDFMMSFFDLFTNVFSVLIVILSAILILNIYLFSKLMSNKYSEEQAKKVYLYQAVWGGVSLLSNQITGVLYLISGVGGYNGHKEEKDIRNGI